MDPLLGLSLEVGLTLLACVLITRYLNPHFRRVLVDLCRTEERAQFWAVFSNLLLIGFPLIIALGFHPEAMTQEAAVFELIGRLSFNLAGYLFALVGVGFIVSIFALFAPRQPSEAE